MQIKNLRIGLKTHYQPILGTLLIAGLITGCASGPKPNTRTATKETKHKRQAQSIPRSAKRELKTAARQDRGRPGSTKNTNYKTPAARRDYTPHKWPSPDQDLWSKIRSGFQFDADGQDRRDVRVWTQYFATHQRHLRHTLQRAKPFLWHIAQELEKRNLPTELALVPFVESGYNPRARSPVGATGMWQFMPITAKHMKLARDWWYDGRNDPIAATGAALDYLETLNERYNGDWMLALAAYNAGPGRIDQALARARAQGGKTNFWSLSLPQETRQYVPQVLALRRLMQSPAKFGITWPRLANAPHTQVVELPGQTSLQVAAGMLNMSTRDLHQLNPGYRRWASSAAGRHHLLVPAEKASAFKQKLASISPGKLINRRTHMVRRGESLGRLAKVYGVSLTALRSANKLRGSQIHAGQRLTIPNPGTQGLTPHRQKKGRIYFARAGDTPHKVAKQHGVKLSNLKTQNGQPIRKLYAGQRIQIQGGRKPVNNDKITVRSGDSVWSIAQNNNISIDQLRRWNGLNRNATHIAVGSTLSVDGPM